MTKLYKLGRVRFGLFFSALVLSMPAFAQKEASIASFLKVANGKGGVASNTFPANLRWADDIDLAGDFDKDGVVDLVVGSSYDNSAANGRGSASIVYLNSDQTVKGITKFAIAESIRQGASVANIGDIDNDGVNDFAVGAITNATNYGSVVIFRMNANGTVKGSFKIASGVTNFETFPGMLPGANAPLFGGSVEAIGDFNGDGVEDIAVGSERIPLGGQGQGGVWLIYLNNNGTVKGYNRISDNFGGFSTSWLDFNDNFGTSITNIGDIDGDGVIDLAIGAKGDDDGATDAGALYLVRLNSNGTVKRVTKISASTSPLLAKALGAGSEFGSSASLIPNYAVQGQRAMLVGAWYADVNGTEKGASYIMRYDTSGAVLGLERVSDLTKNFAGSLDDNDRFGKAVQFYNNIDTNSKFTFFGAANYDDDGNTDAGAMYAFRMNKFDAENVGFQGLKDTLCNNEPFKLSVRIKNNSFVHLTRVPIRIDLIGAQKDSLIDTAVITIAPNGTATVNFSKEFKFTSSGVYSIQSVLSLAGDLFSENDTFRSTFFITPVLTKPNFGRDTNLCRYETYVLNLNNPGNNYLWSTGATTQSINVLDTGTYWGIAYSGSCLVGDTVMVNYYKDASGLDLHNDTFLCAGQTYTLDMGYPDARHTWNTGDTGQTLLVSTPGTYIGTVRYGRCIYRDTVVVTYSNINLSLPDDTVSCEGNTFTIDAGNPGKTYLWSTGETTQTIDVTTTAAYSVIVSQNQCTQTDTVFVDFRPYPVVDLGNDTTICEGQSFSVSAGTADMYLWSTGVTTQGITISSAGTYWVDAINGTTCLSRDTIIVGQNFINTDLGPDTTLCNGDSFLLYAFNPPGATYLWSTGSTDSAIFVKTAGTYTVTTTIGNCSESNSIDVNFILIEDIDLGPDTTICVNDTRTLNAANPGATYLWSTGATTQTINVTQPGTYFVTATLGKCQATDTIVFSNVAFQQIFDRDDTTRCLGTPINLDANNNDPEATFLWNTGATTQQIQVVTPAKYFVTVSKQGCSISDTIDVIFIDAPIVDLGSDTMFCAGATDSLDAGNEGPGILYLWSNGKTTQKINVSRRGTYSVLVSNGTCVVGDTVRIDYFPEFSVSFRNREFLCGDNATNGITLTAGPAMRYQWFPTGDTTAAIVVNTPGTYKVRMINTGCIEEDTVVISECPPEQIFMPNAFTPDGDDLNEVFRAANDNITFWRLRVSDRWGKVWYDGTDPNAGWDGTLNGAEAPEGVYFWYAEFRLDTQFGNVPPTVAKGMVNLLRH